MDLPKNWWIFEWWHVPIITVILLSVILIVALVISTFYTIHEINYLGEDLKEMDETFLKTLSEHDRNVLDQCVRISYQQTREQVTKLWSIYMKKEEAMRKRREEEANQNKTPRNTPILHTSPSQQHGKHEQKPSSSDTPKGNVRTPNRISPISNGKS